MSFVADYSSQNYWHREELVIDRADIFNNGNGLIMIGVFATTYSPSTFSVVAATNTFSQVLQVRACSHLPCMHGLKGCCAGGCSNIWLCFNRRCAVFHSSISCCFNKRRLYHLPDSLVRRIQLVCRSRQNDSRPWKQVCCLELPTLSRIALTRCPQPVSRPIRFRG